MTAGLLVPMKRAMGCLAVAASLLLAKHASAEPTEEARQAFRDGAEKAKSGQWQRAIQAFQRSSTLRPHATTTYNIGYCEMMLGHATRARTYLRRAVAEDDERAEQLGTLRASAEQHLASVEKQVARLSVDAPAGARLSVDGRPLSFESSGPPTVLVAGVRDEGEADELPDGPVVVLLDPGQHKVMLVFQSGGEETRSLTLEPGATERLVFREASRRLGPHKTGAVVLGASALTLLGAGGILAGVAASRWDDATDRCADFAYCPDERGPDLANEARLEANLATAALVSGGIAAAGAAALWLSGPSPFELEVATTGTAVRASFRW